MNPASTTQLHAALLEPVRQRLVARGAVGVILDREDARLDPGLARARECLRVGLVRTHAHDLDPVAAMDLVEQRLEIRTGPGCEDRHAERHDATDSTG